jgi:hypothetical protein
MAFDLKSMPNFNVQETTLGPIDVVLKDEVYYLYNDGIQWMTLSPSHQEVKELYSSYELAYGDVLITGLGFGILALWLCNKPDIKSVTVIEKSLEIIEIFKQFNEVPDNLKIINADANTFVSDIKYDGIFLDHYELQNWDWRLKNMQEFCSRIKHDVFWAWALEEAYLFKTHNLDRKNLHSPNNNYQYFLDISDIASGWEDFAKRFFPNEQSLLQIKTEKIEEYIYNFYNKPLIEYKAKNFSEGEL